ncbi:MULTISPECIES: hypothetical protein [Nocardiaceae]|uniref:Uncharacterized protein n=1 Tax=Rhodococcoides kroppenstedtii TaxID=293050 RepID=A0ABS7NTQ8_9NOCA|nr:MULTISPECIES: hypothetical protein [Rhodococcus]AMY20376.1 hypothetical protein A3Q40_03013 [Rhodococcus sp. PBTS 1]MBY6313887.1 hypothetical protein [Rhodococcus kroppenstedtii]MBY6321390.1 hypothetical protein [Rhodococcus kroppenstedtii]MBY6400089.1 hypothetical protein [Rhodococcus kroppenstedtii]MBY6438511.1 hypothetical protein [Rhodococcus kroppenstedtii]
MTAALSGAATATVGERHTVAAERSVADILGGVGITVRSSSSALGALLADALVPPPAGARVVASHWVSGTEPESIGTGTIGATTLITRVRAGATVDRTVTLVGPSGSVVARGQQTLQWPTSLTPSPTTDFCTTAWAQLVRESLAADPDFTLPLSTWDGSIALRCNDIDGAREVQLRIYRGSVIDVAARTPAGATFTFVATAEQWCDIAFAPRDDFLRRAIAGEYSSAGNGYEYVRLTRALSVIVSHVRALVGRRDGGTALGHRREEGTQS